MTRKTNEAVTEKNQGHKSIEITKKIYSEDTAESHHNLPKKEKKRRRGHGEGTIYQLPNGTWKAQAMIGIDPETGKPKRPAFYGATRKEAADKLADAIHDNKNGVFAEPNKVKFGEWCKFWLNEYSKPHVRPTTYDGYCKWFNNHIIPGLGYLTLLDLQNNPSYIQRFYNQKLSQKPLNGRGRTLSARSVRYIHTLVHECLEQALKDGKILRNPAKATKPPKQEKKEAEYLTLDQMNLFLESISEDRWYTAFITVLGSGLRLGELIALKWENLDLEKSVIYVKESITRVRDFDAEPDGPKTKLIKQPPKTKKGLRAVSIPSHTVSALKRWKAFQNQEKLILKSTGFYKDNGYVFAWEDGRIVEPGNLSKHFLKLVRKCEFPGIHFHSLRHTYASLMLLGNVHPKIVQENLGHSTIGMTLDTYSHVAPELKEAAAETLDGLFTKTPMKSIKKA